MRHGHGAPCVRCPSCLRREVSRNDLFVQVRRHRARTRIDVYGSANNRSDEAGRKARCGSVFETRAARIDQYDAAITAAGCSFDKPAECIEDDGHRTAARHHLQQPLSPRRAELQLASGRRYRSAARTSGRHDPSASCRGKAADVEPAIDAVSAAQAAARFRMARRCLPLASTRRSLREGHPDERRRRPPSLSVPRASCQSIPGHGG